jgi:hypothetical protein
MANKCRTNLWKHIKNVHNISLLELEESDIELCVYKDARIRLEQALIERDKWRESAVELHTAMVDAINAGDWKVDGVCDPDSAMKRVLRLEEKYGEY